MKSFSGNKIMGLSISEPESVDIDDIKDLRLSNKELRKGNFIIPQLK